MEEINTPAQAGPSMFHDNDVKRLPGPGSFEMLRHQVHRTGIPMQNGGIEAAIKIG